MKTSALTFPLWTARIGWMIQRLRERVRKIQPPPPPTSSAGHQRYEMMRERDLLGPIGPEIRRAWWL